MKNIIKKLTLGILIGLSVNLTSCSVDDEYIAVTPTPPKETRIECTTYIYVRKWDWVGIYNPRWVVSDWEVKYTYNNVPGPDFPFTIYFEGVDNRQDTPDFSYVREHAIETKCITVEVK